jgi:outer membrane protein assembly factor BamD
LGFSSVIVYTWPFKIIQGFVKMKLRYGIAFILGCLLLNSCVSTKDPAEAFKGQSAEQIFRGGEQQLAKGNYTTAAKHFEGLDALYPFSEFSEQAMLDSIDAYYQSGDYASATAAAARYIHVYPANPHVDYAWYMKGVSEMVQDRSWPQRYLPIDVALRDPGVAAKAFDDFTTLTQQFPNSAYVPDARKRMVYLRNMFAQKELEIADFYYQKKAYVASANRAAGVLKHYSGSPATEGALVLMIKSYKALGQTEEANKALQTLKLNFPKSKV